MKNFLIITLVLMLTSCSEDDIVLNAGEIAANEIKTQTGDAQITKVDVYEYRDATWYQIESEQVFGISGQFLVVGSSYYNLNNLERFDISGYAGILSIWLR